MRLKQPKIGVYGPLTRNLQKKLSYERISLSWKVVDVFLYLGSRTESSPSLSDIPDPIFLEVADRAYATESIRINAYWEPQQDDTMDLTKFGLINPMADVQTFRFHSYSFEPDGLGRYPVEGDIIKVSFLEQDSKNVFYEVTDIDRKREPETFIVTVSATPMDATQETTEIPTNNDQKLSDLLGRLEDDQDAHVDMDGLDTDGYEVDDPNEDDEYDPRNNEQEEFFDDINRPLF